VVVEGKRECYVFNSEEGSTWPPSDQELVRNSNHALLPVSSLYLEKEHAMAGSETSND
jgi:hypothetical protein